MERVLTVICVHGEGDRKTVNQLRKNVLIANARSQNQDENKILAPDEPADIMVVLRDENHGLRVEYPVTDWDDVEKWKALAGYDNSKRQWHGGARIKVTFAPASEGE